MSTKTDADAIVWPEHKGSLHVTHNQHHNYYEKVEDAISSRDMATYSVDDFPDTAEIAKCIATDSVWSIQWYPNTPVGFCIVHAATLSRALEKALEP